MSATELNKVGRTSRRSPSEEKNFALLCGLAGEGTFLGRGLWGTSHVRISQVKSLKSLGTEHRAGNKKEVKEE